MISSTTLKRKRVVLSLYEKQQVLQGLDNGEKPSDLCEKFGISRQQVSDIKKNRVRISRYCDSVDNSNGLKRKVLKMSTAPEVDQALYEWYQAQKLAGDVLTNDLLQEKAVSLFIQLCPDESAESFKASKGWLRNFKRRHGLQIKADDIQVAEEVMHNPMNSVKHISSSSNSLQIENKNEKLNKNIEELGEKQQNLADSLALLTGDTTTPAAISKENIDEVKMKETHDEGISDVAFL